MKNKKGMIYAILLMTCLVIGLSYGAFIFSTDKYRSSELLISKLNYSIDIQEDGSSKSTINGTSVIVPASTKVYLNITLTSVNEIDSKYTLAYKTSSNAKVQYTDRTQWNTKGVIKGIDNNTYSKKIRVVIDNSEVTTSSIVNFQVYGGYSFNSYANIELTDGYVSVSGPYTEVATNIGNRLVDIIESDTSCLTSTSNTCLYGGENIKNYVQYPEDSDKTKNLWRIIGSYQIDGTTLPKLISQSTTSTSTSTLTTDLTSFYNTLEDKEVLVQETNKFNCFTSTCTESTYSNIGLLTDYEYNQIGGVNSYLSSTENYYINSSTGIKEVTSSGINAFSSTSGLKPTIYLQTGVQVTGSGTANDPYIISPASDINLVSYTLNGETTDKTYADLLKTNVVSSVTCKNGTTAEWNYDKNGVLLTNIHTPDYCTIDFGDGYSVSLTATNGTVTPPTTVSVGYGGSVTFNVSQNTGYSTTLITNTCGGTLSSDGKTYTVSNVTGDKTCSIDFKKLDYQIAVSVSGGSSSPTSQKIEYNSSYEFTITPSTGYTLAAGTATCNGGATASLNTSTGKLTVSKVTNAQTCSVTLQKQKYNVTLTVVNGSGGGTQSTSHGSNAVYTVTPSTGYKAELETNTCGGTLSGSTYTVSNVTSTKSCSITFKSNAIRYVNTSLATIIQANAVNENGYRYEGTNPNNYIYMVKYGSNELWRIIGLFPDGASGENVIRVRKVGYESAAYDSNSTNHWPNTTLYTTLSNVYSIANYKNTVNYKMYLGGAYGISSYTTQDLYDMERMLNSKGTAGKTSQDSYGGVTTFIGSVGLMYPSDYGYGVLASVCARTIKSKSYDKTSACYTNNWLYQGSGSSQWLISPTSAAVASVVFSVFKSGYVTDFGYAPDSYSFSPVMALESDVMVTGSGTQSDPYVMN